MSAYAELFGDEMSDLKTKAKVIPASSLISMFLV